MENRVLVVGAGPVGLMLASELRTSGADVVVYDRLPAPSGESRALGFTKRVSEVFEQRGLLSRLGEFRWGRTGHFGGVGIDLDMLDDDHHGVLGLSQARTEEMLTGRLSEMGVTVRRGYDLVDLRDTGEGVEAVFDGPDGRHVDTAAYLVGCDGGRSTVRGLAGIEAPGWKSTRGMYMADVTGVEVRQRPTGAHVPGGNMVLSVSLGDGYYRVLIHDRSLPPEPDSASLTFTDVADAWQRMTGESLHHGSARWMAAFGNGAGLAAEYRRGRVLLAGDAAHDTPPLAGWGLSTGIQDAVNLGWKLAAVVGGWAPDGLLDTYHAERHPLGRQLLRNTHAATMLYLSGEEMDPLRSVMRELVSHKSAADHLAGMVSGLGVRYDMGEYDMGEGEHPLLGRRLSPDRELETPRDGRVRVAELLHPARGVLIDADDSGDLRALAAAWSDRVDVVSGRWVPEEGGGRPHDAPGPVLIRPDGYVAWTASGGGDPSDALGRWFGAARKVVNA